MTLIFATNNQNKIAEISRITSGISMADLEIISLKAAGIEQEIPEPFNTLEENAFAKSLFIYRHTSTACFSEDTGLEVNALAGAPGVHSARYAGEPADNMRNIQLLLSNMENTADRSARFRTIISLILKKVEYQFEGICKGTITTVPAGSSGFGYDAVFIPEGDTRTFAEMTMDEKNKFSHRKKATGKLISFLTDFYAKS